METTRAAQRNEETGLQWGPDYLDASAFGRSWWQLFDEACSAVQKVLQDARLSPEGRQEKARPLAADFEARRKALVAEWEDRFRRWNAALTEQARADRRPPAEETAYQLAYGNTRENLRVLLASGKRPEQLVEKMEEVVLRDVAGEVQAWAELLPVMLPREWGGLLALQARAQQIIDARRPESFTLAKANAVYHDAQERRFTEMRDTLARVLSEAQVVTGTPPPTSTPEARIARLWRGAGTAD
jgi:hypothetical protein